jgi:hypothetical protein
VRRVQPRQRVDQHAQLHRQREATLLAAHDHLRKRLAVEVFHHQHGRAVDLDDLVGLHDVRVMQARRQARLADEHQTEVGVAGQALAQHLDDDQLGEAAGTVRDRQVDIRRPALSQRQYDPVLPDRLDRPQFPSQTQHFLRPQYSPRRPRVTPPGASGKRQNARGVFLR